MLPCWSCSWGSHVYDWNCWRKGEMARCIVFNYGSVIAKLWQPEGLLSRAPYPYRKKEKTHDMIFSWLSYLAIVLVGMYAQRRWQSCTIHVCLPDSSLYMWVARGMLPWFTVLPPPLILYIHVMVYWHLSKEGNHWPVTHDHIVGSSLELTEVFCFLEVDSWLSAGFRLDCRLVSN